MCHGCIQALLLKTQILAAINCYVLLKENYRCFESAIFIITHTVSFFHQACTHSRSIRLKFIYLIRLGAWYIYSYRCCVFDGIRSFFGALLFEIYDQGLQSIMCKDQGAGRNEVGVISERTPTAQVCQTGVLLSSSSSSSTTLLLLGLDTDILTDTDILNFPCCHGHGHVAIKRVRKRTRKRTFLIFHITDTDIVHYACQNTDTDMDTDMSHITCFCTDTDMYLSFVSADIYEIYDIYTSKLLASAC
jgi:hypothetical protein